MRAALLILVVTLQSAALDPAPIVDALATGLRERYIDVDVADRVAGELRRKHAAGDYARASSRAELASMLTDTLQAVGKDRHLRVLAAPPAVPPASRPLVGRVEVLTGNIGYLEVPSLGAAPATASEALAAAMTTLAGTTALVIDLRSNGGGRPDTVGLLAAYLLDAEPVVLGTIRDRVSGTATENRTPANVTGPRYGATRPVFVLIDRRTASAAESFAYHLQAMKRVVVVGEQSAGAANPGGFVRLPDGFLAFISTGRVTNPITGSNWEGSGVSPDIRTEAAAALEAARAAAAASRPR